MPYVYSTLANDNTYHHYDVEKGGKQKDIPTPIKSVLIKGGAGIATKHLVTPLGIVTGVTDEELAFLKQDEVFQTHVANGFITYDNKKVDAEVAVANMRSRDNSAPVVPEDSHEEDAAKPAVKSIKSDKTAFKRNSGAVKNNLQ